MTQAAMRFPIAVSVGIAALALSCLAVMPHPAAAGDAGQVLQLPPADQQELASLLGPDVVGEALPARPLLNPKDYMTTGKGPQIFRVRDSDGKVSTEQHEFSPVAATDSTDANDTGAPNTGARWEYRIGSKPRAIFALQPDGTLAMVQDFNTEQKVVSDFLPAEPLIIPGLAPGQSRQAVVKVVVADIGNPRHINYRGELDVTYTHLGRYRITVPAGSYDADLVKWTYQGSIGPAHVKATQFRFLAEKNAMIAMIELRNISAMLIYHDDTRQGKLLLTPAQP